MHASLHSAIRFANHSTFPTPTDARLILILILILILTPFSPPVCLSYYPPLRRVAMTTTILLFRGV